MTAAITPAFDTSSFYAQTPYGLASDLQSETDKLYEVVIEGKNKKFVCIISDCQKIFRFHSEMQRHIASHSTYRPHKCTFEGCMKEFKRAGALENHLRSQHTGEAPLLCPYPGCGQRFSTEAKYRYHIVSHLDEKPHKCSYPNCQKSFMTLSQLKQHEKSPSVHRKLEMLYKLEEREEKQTVVYDDKDLEKSDVNMMMIEPTKKVKYEAENKRLSDLLCDLQTNKAVVKEKPKAEAKKDPMLQQILYENELLRQRLENSEQMLTMMKKQIDDINVKMVDAPQIMDPILVNPVDCFDKAEINVFKDVDAYLIHDPLVEDMRSYFREGDFMMQSEFKEESLNNDKVNFFLPNFSLDEFESPLREMEEK